MTVYDGGNEFGKKARGFIGMEQNITMEIAQLLLSLLHAWGIDMDLDKVCEGKLGLLRPMLPVSFGVLSKGGYMSLLLPTWQPGNVEDLDARPEPSNSTTTAKAASNTKPTASEKRTLEGNLPPEVIKLEKLTRLFTARTHWELSTTLTSNHLLAIIALANTLMSMNNATFVPEQERNRRLHRQNTVTAWNFQNKVQSEESEELYTAQQAQIKQGWSLLATLHCVLLPDKVELKGSKNFKRPQVEMMARRWQHHCLEIREAAQALLLAELGRLGPKGRKKLVEDWSQYLPKYATLEAQQQIQASHQQHLQQHNPHIEQDHAVHEEEEEEEEEVVEELSVRKPSSAAELKRKETTAVVLLGVIGAEFGQDTSERRHEDRRKSSVAEGFNINNNLARLTSRYHNHHPSYLKVNGMCNNEIKFLGLALTHLLLAPPSSKLPAHTQLRRAAIDLIGRGFTVWEPYLEVSKILLGLLELCCEADKLVPSMTYGLPLTPAADSCRTARHALTLIATARPAAFITCMAREVARYNTIAQNAQALNVNLSNSVLHRAKPEILRGIELLIDKMQSEMSDLLVEVIDIILHCLDPGHLKSRPLSEVFPAVCRFNQVSHCFSTRRIAVGAKSGQIALYELRYPKCQMIPAHEAALTAVSFSPDGKFLASYSCVENRLSFWQTSTGMFRLGQSQTKCTKSYSTSPIPDMSRMNPMKTAKLIWINCKTVTLMLADGTESRFTV
ncbi:hypothetical protein RUM43_011893 [Polyplax serrata]|uniref:WD repeat-containing protein 7 n=1 Tax=Polyplax serrata TaxID=468196 RepID=A0AAN8P1Q3_POLSC